MLFRTNSGKLVELKRLDYTNDYIYYKKVMELKLVNNTTNSVKPILRCEQKNKDFN